MKLSTILLTTLLVVILVGLVATNYLFKQEYNKIDKTDPLWNYTTLSEKPFKHLVITGGNNIAVIFEPNSKTSLKVIKYDEPELKKILFNILNDTLYLSFPDSFYKKYTNYIYYQNNYPIIHISSPELKSIKGNNYHLVCKKMTQQAYKITANGKSKIEIESASAKVQEMEIEAGDSTSIHFNEAKGTKSPIEIETGKVQLNQHARALFSTIKFKTLILLMDDEAGVELSGYNMNRFEKKAGH